MKRKSNSNGNTEKRKRSKVSKVENETSESIKAEILDIQGVREGMCLLGCVMEVRSDCFLVSLPGCMVGRVPLAHVSGKYTEMIMHSQEEEVPALSTLVELGALFPCKVLEVTFRDEMRKPVITLSIDPKVVNADLRSQSLYLKMILHAAVQSTEDHGYILDLGIPSVQGFLPFSACGGVRTLDLGKVVPVCVRKLPNQKRGGGNVVWVSMVSHNEPFEEIEEDNMKLNSILPGAKVTAYITEVKQPFIYMKCMSFDACANMMSLGTSHQNLAETTKVTGTVLYVHPISHLIYIHLGPTPTPSTFSTFFRLKKFDLVKNAKYQYFWYHRLLFKVNKGTLGFLRKGHLPESGSLSQESLSTNPVIPNSRVIFLHYMDNLVQLSLNASTINLEIIKPEDVQIGDIYEGVVSKHVESGMFVGVCPGFGGFIRNIHMSDSLVSMPEKLHPVGSKVKCRVLSQYNDSFTLSSKESLLSLPPDDILADYGQATKGRSFKGVVAHKGDRNMLVLFFNNVKGVVPSEEIPESSVFFVGQTVSCRVLQCSPAKQRMKLSLMGDSHASKSQVKLPTTGAETALTEGKFDPKKKHKARIETVTNQQLNILLEGGLKGRVHVTEIGNTEEGYMSLKDFRPFQRLQVHVIGTYDRKKHNFMEISHRRTEMCLECALSYPPPSPLQREHMAGMDVTGYVKEATNTSCTLWLSPIQTATLDYLHFSDNPTVLRKLKKKLKPGLAINAKVLKVERKTKHNESFYDITLTKLGVDPAVAPGRNTVGLVQIACPEKGVVLRLPGGHIGRVTLSDLQDVPSSLQPALEKCRKLLFVTCHVVEVNASSKVCTVSLRKSRLYDDHSLPEEDFLPELALGDIEPGFRTKGFVKMAHNDHLIVNFGRLLDGQVTLHRCNVYGCTFCAHTREVLQKHQPGEVIEIVVDKVTPSPKGLYPLSLPHMEGMGLSEQRRLTVTEDIDWDED